jgi:hypothetical protein
LQLDLYHLLKDTKGFYQKNQMDSIQNNIISITEIIKNNQDLYFDLNQEAIPATISLESTALPEISKDLHKKTK